MSTDRRLLSWAFIAALTAGLSGFTAIGALERYHEFRSGWSWDLAYYNQWFWAMTRGDGQLSVRPVSSFAQEGPSVWKTNYLAPIRFLLLPFYAIHPDPRTLLVIYSLMFWWIVPAAYTLVRSETDSEVAAVSAAALVPLTPLLWPLAWNDFRELQVAMPFVLWAVQGVRGRRVGLAAVSIALMLSCRQEFAAMVSTFAFMPPRVKESYSRTLRWRYALFSLGLTWILFGYFGYLSLSAGRGAPNQFIQDFLGPKASIPETLVTAVEFVCVGLGPWAFLAILSPKVGLLAIPWTWSLCNGRWALRYLGTEQWHHVRYAVLPVIAVLAAGLIGYAEICLWARGRRRGRAILLAVACVVGIGCLPGLTELPRRMSLIPIEIDREEAAAIWAAIRQVGPEDGALAAYEVAAPLSSRRRLFSYVLEQNKPRGFPELGPEIRWIFVKNRDLDPRAFVRQGFEIVYQGPLWTILERNVIDSPGTIPASSAGSHAHGPRELASVIMPK